MSQPITVHAWLQGGPADGAVRLVECGPNGRPPELLLLRGGKVFVGSSAEPAPPKYPAYELEPGAEPIEATLWPYRHVETLYQ